MRPQPLVGRGWPGGGGGGRRRRDGSRRAGSRTGARGWRSLAGKRARRERMRWSVPVPRLLGAKRRCPARTGGRCSVGGQRRRRERTAALSLLKNATWRASVGICRAPPNPGGLRTGPGSVTERTSATFATGIDRKRCAGGEREESKGFFWWVWVVGFEGLAPPGHRGGGVEGGSGRVRPFRGVDGGRRSGFGFCEMSVKARRGAARSTFQASGGTATRGRRRKTSASRLSFHTATCCSITLPHPPPPRAA
jgi:hypothetical protein